MQRVLMKQKRMMSFQPGFYYIPFAKFSAVWPYLCLSETAQCCFASTRGTFTGKDTCSVPRSKGFLSWAKEDAAQFHLPATAANKPLPINEPEVIQILSASPSCHQCSQQPAPQTQLASPKSAQVHAKEHKHNTKIKFPVEIKSTFQQRAIATKAEILRHLLPPRLTCLEPIWHSKEGTTCARENIRGQTRHHFSKSAALCPSSVVLQPVPLGNFLCTSLLTTGSKILPNKCPFYHLPVVSWNQPSPPFSQHCSPSPVASPEDDHSCYQHIFYRDHKQENYCCNLLKH